MKLLHESIPKQYMYDVFISYSRKDSKMADEICSVLNKYDITYFIDRNGISGGFDFTEVIANAIEASKVFLFIGSANSYASKYAVNEVMYAYQKKPNNSIIPYVIDDALMPNKLQFLFSIVNVRNIQEHPIDTVLVNDIFTILNKDLPETGSNEEELKPNKIKPVTKSVFQRIRASLSLLNPWVIALIIVQLCVIVFFIVYFAQLYNIGYISKLPHPNEWWYNIALTISLALSFVGTIGILFGNKKCFFAVCALDIIELILIGIISASVYSRFNSYHFTTRLYIILQDLGYSFVKVPFHVVIMALMAVCHCCLMRVVLMIKKEGKSAWSVLK